MFDEKYLKTKIKSCNNRVTANLNNVNNNKKKAPKKRIKCICLSAIVIDSTFKLGKIYFPQTFLEECKYKIKEKEILSLITNDLDSSPDGDSEEEEIEDFEESSE